MKRLNLFVVVLFLVVNTIHSRDKNSHVDLVSSVGAGGLINQIGDEISIEFNIYNNGNVEATDIKLQTYIPSGIKVISYEIKEVKNVKQDYDLNTGVWSVAKIKPQGEDEWFFRLKFKAKVLPTGYYNITSNVIAKEKDSDIKNNFSFYWLKVGESVDLGISATTHNSFPVKGGKMEITIKLSNNSENPATEVLVDGKLPQNLTYVKHEVLGGLDKDSYNPETGKWLVGKIPANTKEHIGVLKLTVRVEDKGEGFIDFSVLAHERDDDFLHGFKFDKINYIVIEEGNINTFYSFPFQYEENGKKYLEYTITVENNTENSLKDVTYDLKLGESYQLVERSITNGIINSTNGVWEIPELLRFEQEKIFIKLLVLNNNDLTILGEVTGTPVEIIESLSNAYFVFNEQLSLYPNPVKDQLTIEPKNGTQVQSITIKSIQGQLIQSVPQVSKTSVDVSNLPQGMYLVQVKTDKGTTSTKVVKE